VVPESHGFEPGEVFDLIAHYPGTSFFFAPTMVTRLIDHPAAAAADTANLKSLIYGGGPMYLEDVGRALARLGPKLTQIYGQGESPMTITVLDSRAHADTEHPRFSQRLASVGLPFTCIEVRVVDEDDNDVALGESGEILVRGDTVMSGYWRDEEATRETLRGGWLHTGDVGALDGDGFLTLKDRSKDMIISGGTNIYPREIEEVLLRHEGVAECSVVGRPHGDWGEEVVAFVVLKEGATVAEAELDELCLSHIARFKRPRGYRFVDGLPKNNYGKVLKTDLRRRLADEE
jgi:long-chain acyl-CoA synthetase